MRELIAGGQIVEAKITLHVAVHTKDMDITEEYLKEAVVQELSNNGYIIINSKIEPEGTPLKL